MSKMIWIHVDMTQHDSEGLPVDLSVRVTDELGRHLNPGRASVVWETGAEYGDELDHTADIIQEKWTRNGVREHFRTDVSSTRDEFDEHLAKYFNLQRIQSGDALAGFELDWMVIPILAKHFPKFADCIMGLQMIDMRQIQWLCENVNPELDENINNKIKKPGNERSHDITWRFIETYKMYLENFLITGDR